jgi:Lon protease-like protein
MYSAESMLAEAERTAAFVRALERLPMFPLPNVVLLPNTFLPLHIFEPRYRKMTRDMLEGNRLVAMALQLRAADPLADDDNPPVATIAGVGEVVMAQDLPDGRFNLVLRGRARVRIEDELVSDEPYRLVRASEIPDDPPGSQIELLDAEASLRALAGGLAEALPEGGELLKQVVASQTSPSALVDVVASTLIADPRLRQELLETTDVMRRMLRVSAEVASMAAELTTPGRWN